jgi:hypothetical protein
MQDRQCACERNNEGRSRNHCSRGKALSITHAVYMSVALGIQLAEILRAITMSSASCPAVPHFSALSHKRNDVGKSVVEHKIGF